MSDMVRYCLRVFLNHASRPDIPPNRYVRQVISKRWQRTQIQTSLRFRPLRCRGDAKDKDAEAVLVIWRAESCAGLRIKHRNEIRYPGDDLDLPFYRMLAEQVLILERDCNISLHAQRADLLFIVPANFNLGFSGSSSSSSSAASA